MQQKLDALSLVKATIDYLRSMKTVSEMAAVENGAVENGYGRVDAFGVARNLLFGSDPRNLRPQNGPVSFPHMWGLKTTAWLQWGANINSVMERNIGQTLGVGARFDSNFVTTSRLDNLNAIEKRVYTLTPPDWRDDVFGAIDRARADRGKPLYDKLCSNCHDKPFAVSPTGLVTYQLFRLNEVGTSPVVATNFDRTVFTAKGERRLADAAFEAIEAIKQESRQEPQHLARDAGRLGRARHAAAAGMEGVLPQHARRGRQSRMRRVAACIPQSRWPASGLRRRISTMVRWPTCGTC